MTHPTIAEIQTAVCQRFGLKLIEMSSDRRSRRIARPRQIAMYLSRELTPLSLPLIGRLFGHRDHTTVMHACQVVEGICRQDRGFAAVVDELRQALAQPDQLILPQVTSVQIVAAKYARLLA